MLSFIRGEGSMLSFIRGGACCLLLGGGEHVVFY